MNPRQGILITVVIVVVAGLLMAPSSPGNGGGEEDGRLRVVASFYPLGYMARQIGGDHVAVTVLIPANQEVHGWQPTTGDIIEANRADVLIYHGAGLDPWFEDDVLDAVDDDDKVILETTRGMDLLHEAGPDRDGDDDPDHGHEGADPHTWLSPIRAMQMVDAIHATLVGADPEHEGTYDSNRDELMGLLATIGEAYEDALNSTVHDTLIVTHEAYGYIGEDYDLVQRGVIGISAEEQPSARSMADLVDLMEREGIYTVFVDPVYSGEYARTLEGELEDRTGEDVRVLKLYVMLGPRDGLDLLGQLEANLESLTEGLGQGP